MRRSLRIRGTSTRLEIQAPCSSQIMIFTTKTTSTLNRMPTGFSKITSLKNLEKVAKIMFIRIKWLRLLLNIVYKRGERLLQVLSSVSSTLPCTIRVEWVTQQEWRLPQVTLTTMTTHSSNCQSQRRALRSFRITALILWTKGVTWTICLW